MKIAEINEIQLASRKSAATAALCWPPKLNCCTLPLATATTEFTEAPVEDFNDPHSIIIEAL